MPELPSDHPRVQFIRVEVKTGLTLAKLAQTERFLQDRAGADRAIGLARKALETARHFLPSLALTAAVKSELQQNIETLQTEIDRYHKSSGDPSSR
jgi:hypothetical protein